MKLVEATFGLIFKVWKITEREVRKEIFQNKFWNIFTWYLYGLLVPAQDLRIASSWPNNRIHRIFSVPFSILLQVLRKMISLPLEPLCVWSSWKMKFWGQWEGHFLPPDHTSWNLSFVPTYPVHPVSPSGTCKSSSFIQGHKQPFFMFTLNTRVFQGHQ